jgi:hypothetical protein
MAIADAAEDQGVSPVWRRRLKGVPLSSSCERQRQLGTAYGQVLERTVDDTDVWRDGFVDVDWLVKRGPHADHNIPGLREHSQCPLSGVKRTLGERGKPVSKSIGSDICRLPSRWQDGCSQRQSSFLNIACHPSMCSLLYVLNVLRTEYLRSEGVEVHPSS